MTNPVPSPVNLEKEKPLQFDQVEYAPEAEAESAVPLSRPACAICGTEIIGDYYEAGGQIVCPSCRSQVEGAMSSRGAGGRVARALLYGGATAVAGSALYWLIRVIAKDEGLAIVALALGWMIGTAVRRGTGGRGGRFYQIAAVVLTYFSISYSYVPSIYQALSEKVRAEETRSPAGSGSSADASRSGAGAETAPAAAPAAPGLPADSAAATERSDNTKSAAAAAAGDTDRSGDASSRSAASPETVTPRELVGALLGLLLLPLMIPVMFIKSSWIMALIYGFGLWQAWQMNQRAVIAFSGPYSLQGAPAQPQPNPVDHPNPANRPEQA